MNWLQKLLGKKDELPESPSHAGKGLPAAPAAGALPFAGLEGIRFGRYSDNNKSRRQTQSWYLAEDRFKEKRFPEAFDAFFDYLQDAEEGNVVYKREENQFSFTLIQGSKKVHGECNGEIITASSALAVMETPGTAVMRRLLELNYSLYYSHSALDAGNTLYMVFISDVSSSNPSKLYYGLRELATKADRQDDLILSDFAYLKPTDQDHIQKLPENEVEVKYNYFRKWIQDTLNRVPDLNQDSFSGAIAYLLLTLIYRIDFLIQPEAKLLSELEKINGLYWDKKDEIALIERNQMMKEAIRKLLDITKEEFSQSLYRSKATFSIATPPKTEKVRDHIFSANKDSHWYVENKYPDIALVINEYGLVYNQFIYSMPRVQTDLIIIYMAVMHSDFFSDMGMSERLYDPENKQFNKDAIVNAINQVIAKYRDKFKELKWDHNKISYDSLYDFGVDFSDHLSSLNLESKRD